MSVVWILVNKVASRGWYPRTPLAGSRLSFTRSDLSLSSCRDLKIKVRTFNLDN